MSDANKEYHRKWYAANKKRLNADEKRKAAKKISDKKYYSKNREKLIRKSKEYEEKRYPNRKKQGTIPKFKKCTGRCGEEKLISEFDTYKKDGRIYYKARCKECTAADRKDRYHIVLKVNPDYVRKNRENSKRYVTNHPDWNKEYDKKFGARNRKNYYDRNAEKMRQRAIKVYHVNRDAVLKFWDAERKKITDRYIKSLLRCETTPEMIEAKRSQILINRIKKAIKEKQLHG